MGGNSSLNQQITAWVEKNGTAVKQSAYDKSASSESSSSSSSSSSQSTRSNQSTLYRPDPSDVS
ncbi:hypothetical protein [Streptomyces sp. NPDC051636]|uniref:hypothetical protein n=1 Tax=Streptomyces sp. NPDC051636 TaxID=3365663 RepID=UPI00378F133B